MQAVRGLGFAAVVSLLSMACGQLGAVKQANLPYDAQARKAEEAEIAKNPCRSGDVNGCMQRCRADEAGACNALGVMLEYGGSSPADGALASGFYARACDASYAPGCTNLAWLYTLGKGVPKDPQQSMALFTRAYEASKLACRRGDASGCLMAGDLLLEGRGVEPNDRLALGMFRAACDGGERRGCDRAAAIR